MTITPENGERIDNETVRATVDDTPGLPGSETPIDNVDGWDDGTTESDDSLELYTPPMRPRLHRKSTSLVVYETIRPVMPQPFCQKMIEYKNQLNRAFFTYSQSKAGSWIS